MPDPKTAPDHNVNSTADPDPDSDFSLASGEGSVRAGDLRQAT